MAEKQTYRDQNLSVVLYITEKMNAYPGTKK